jgi:hypothetical protein
MPVVTGMIPVLVAVVLHEPLPRDEEGRESYPIKER